MSALLKREGVPFRVVIFPMPEQVWNTAVESSAYQGRLQEMTREIGVPTLDLLPAFRTAAADGQKFYIFWDWHPNNEGHRVAAQAIEGFIRPLIAHVLLRIAPP